MKLAPQKTGSQEQASDGLGASIYAPGPMQGVDVSASANGILKESLELSTDGTPGAPKARSPTQTQANVEAIVRAYEETELSAEDIAIGFELDKSLVHVVLAQKSRLYRIKENVNDDGTKFDVVSDDDFCLIKEALMDMVKRPDILKPADRAKNIRWLIDEKKGRNNLIKTMPVQNNLWQLNMFLRKNDEKYNEGLKRLKQSKEVVNA